LSWLRYFRRNRRGEELSGEIEAYLAEEIADNIAAGMNGQEAVWAAHRKFGNITGIKETVREMNTIGFLDALWQDFRYAFRGLLLNPGFFAIATLSLALGIGANTAIFHLLDAVRLRSLPVKSPEELVQIRIPPNTDHCCSGNFSARNAALTYPLFEQLKQQQQAFSGLFAFGDTRFDLTTGGQVRFAEGYWVSGDFFRTLGVPALLGRVFTEDDDRPGCGSPGAVISYPFWQREYGGDANAIGQKLTLDGHAFEIIGVTPRNFFGVEVGRGFDVMVPTCAEPSTEGENSHLAKRSDWWISVMGRLKPGWTATRAAAQLAAVSPSLFQSTLPALYTPETAKYYLKFKLTALPAESGVSGLRKVYGEPLVMLLAIAGLVLLIACANLANLMLARASVREREIAVRLAIGASRGRLIRQLLVESMLLAVIGALLGAVLAQALSTYLLSFLSTSNSPIFVDLGTDWRVLGFTAALAMLTCILFGLTPAIRATRTSPGAVMKASSRGLTAGRERFGLRRALVVSQVALSLVLLVGALLFVRSLQNLLTLDAGFRAEGLLTTAIDASRLNYPAARRAVLYRELLDRLRATPGVEVAAQAQIVPINGDRWNDMITIPGQKDSEDMITNFTAVSGGYFRTLGSQLLAGRDFDDHDAMSAPTVAIVNQSFVRKFLKGANPLGKTVRIVTGPGEKPLSYEIVGLTKDAKYTSLRDDFSSTVFVDAAQREAGTGTSYIVRSREQLGPLLASIKRTINAVNPSISFEFKTFHEQIGDSLLRERLMATLSGFFGLLAATLATVGLYGVISYMVARRRNEIGIRIALGADRWQVLGLVLGEAGKLVAIGLVIGIALAAAAAQAAGSMLYGLKPHDPLTIVMAAFLLALVAVPASFLPARRAARLEPMIALREE
jgi:predicted permease